MKKLIAALLALVMALSIAACGQKKNDPDTSNPTGSTTPTKSPEELREIYRSKSYTGEAADVVAAHDTVVATLGDAELTNGMLHFYYWMSVYDMLNSYGSYVTQIGLDPAKPLQDQPCSGTDGSWQHYFLDSALKAWQYYQSMATECDTTQTPLLPEYQGTEQAFYDDLKKTADKNGFSTIDAMVQADMGVGCTAKDYYNYSLLGNKAHSYFNKLFYDIEITDDMLEAYFTEHEASLAVNGITKNSGDSFLVRHILFQVAEEKSDADWEACRQKAQDLLDQWLAGEATEDSFAALAKEHSEDPGSKAEGGLYRGLSSQTNFVQEFKDWYLDKDRKAGDYGLVKTSYGYHIMYFSGTEPMWKYYCHESLTDELSADAVDKVVKKYELVVDYDKILLATVTLVNDK